MNRNLLVVVALLIGGCGGGSSGTNNSSKSSNIIASSSTLSSSVINSSATSSSQSSVSREFGLHKLNALMPGEVYASRLKGVNSVGTTIHGDVLITNEKEELMDGILVVPRVISFKEYTGSGNGSNSLIPAEAWIITQYIEVSTGNLISFKRIFFGYSDVQSCRSLSPYHMPATVNVGDSSLMPDFDCNGRLLSGDKWTASAKEDDQISLNITYVMVDPFGKDENITINYVLDANGNIVSVTVKGLTTNTHLNGF